jgi:hypothetical protein
MQIFLLFSLKVIHLHTLRTALCCSLKAEQRSLQRDYLAVDDSHTISEALETCSHPFTTPWLTHIE